MCSSFTVFGFTVYPYTVCMVLGAGCVIAVFAVRTFRGHAGEREAGLYALQTLIVAMAAGLPAAIFADSLFKWWETGEFAIRGTTFYGGLLFSCLMWSLLLLPKRRRVGPVSQWFDTIAPGIAAGHSIGRIGCFLGGCCYGSPTDLPIGVVFPEGSLPYEMYGATPLHPTQLYEAAFLVILFLVLITMPREGAFARYLVLYGTARFLIEFLRADDRGTVPFLPFSPAQALSLLLILIGAAILIFHTVRQRTASQKMKILPQTHD